MGRVGGRVGAAVVDVRISTTFSLDGPVPVSVGGKYSTGGGGGGQRGSGDPR